MILIMEIVESVVEVILLLLQLVKAVDDELEVGEDDLLVDLAVHLDANRIL